MTNSQLIVRVLMEGALGAVVLIVIAFLLPRFSKDIIGRSLLIIFLIVAAGVYFGLAVGAGAAPRWTLSELAHCVVFGAMAFAGLARLTLLDSRGVGVASGSPHVRNKATSIIARTARAGPAARQVFV